MSKFSKQATTMPSIINEPAIPIPTSTPININPVPIQNQKGKNKLSDLALNCLELVLVDSTQDRRTCVEDAPEDEDEYLECLLRKNAEAVYKKPKTTRSSKKSKNKCSIK
ncbi:10423_t:CDS:1 [Gigaspora rosea]|nr:10423_t:CDS:1 [Gigaspora rosea]